jgi:hypothetical protein
METAMIQLMQNMPVQMLMTFHVKTGIVQALGGPAVPGSEYMI